MTDRVSAPELGGVSEILRFFRSAPTPVYFVSATAFTVLGIDRWLPALRCVTYYDSFDGYHPNVFVPRHHGPPAFESIEDVCNHLLAHEDVHDFVGENGAGRAVFLELDEETERLAEEIGLEVALPSVALRERLSSNIETPRLADEAEVPCLPNGARPEEQDADAGVLVRRRAAVEGVVTRHGTLVGPLVTELTGFSEPAPYGGGWCANDVGTALSEQQRRLAREYTQRLGDRLGGDGYRGCFELDFVADPVSGELHLRELDPRVPGAGSLTSVTAVAYGDPPLLLFHLLEFADVDYELDVAALNEAWAQTGAQGEWSVLVLKQTDADVELVTHAPRSGVWRLDPKAPGGVRFARRETDWHTLASEDEAFYLRIAAEGHFRYAGADLGILVTRGRLQTREHELTERGLLWIWGIRSQFQGQPPPLRAPLPPPEPFSLTLI